MARLSAVVQDPIFVRGLVVPVAATAALGLLELWLVRRQHKDDPLLKLYEARLRVLESDAAGDEAPRRVERLGGSRPASPAASGGAGERALSPAPAPSPEESAGAKVQAAGESPRDAACLPCTRAHLLAASEILNEAARMAPRMGADHKEIRRRVKRAAGELLVLERFDLEPRQLEQLPPNERAVIEEVYPGISRLRQELVNGADSPEAIRKAAAEAEKLYEAVEERTRGKGRVAAG